jgi:hypothetical protein
MESDGRKRRLFISRVALLPGLASCFEWGPTSCEARSFLYKTR